MTCNFTAALAAGLILSAFPAVGQTADGHNVTLVVFGTPNGKTLGSYLQKSRQTWIEQSVPSGSHFDFNEVRRDDWSVYLQDPSRNVSIQLDLHTRKVVYSDETGGRRELYQVLDASSKMNGWLASRVGYTDGSGRMTGEFESPRPGLWVERSLPSGESRFRFREVGRDDWSVYLEDRSRNVAIQLDLHTRKVMYNQIGDSGRREIYTIEDAR
jgi:hypothetical protein